jgi:hypothetical protein
MEQIEFVKTGLMTSRIGLGKPVYAYTPLV